MKQNDESTLIVDYASPPQAFMTFFELTLDKTTGQGHWQWFDMCLVCDRIVDPFAKATITSFREVVAGDFDEDGIVDAADLAAWKGGFGNAIGAVHKDGDADGDADVDGADVLIWQRQLGSAASLAGTAAVPEPSTSLLLFLGILLIRIRGAKQH